MLLLLLPPLIVTLTISPHSFWYSGIGLGGPLEPVGTPIGTREQDLWRETAPERRSIDGGQEGVVELEGVRVEDGLVDGFGPRGRDVTAGKVKDASRGRDTRKLQRVGQGFVLDSPQDGNGSEVVFDRAARVGRVDALHGEELEGQEVLGVGRRGGGDAVGAQDARRPPALALVLGEAHADLEVAVDDGYVDVWAACRERRRPGGVDYAIRDLRRKDDEAVAHLGGDEVGAGTASGVDILRDLDVHLGPGRPLPGDEVVDAVVVLKGRRGGACKDVQLLGRIGLTGTRLDIQADGVQVGDGGQLGHVAAHDGGDRVARQLVLGQLVLQLAEQRRLVVAQPRVDPVLRVQKHLAVGGPGGEVLHPVPQLAVQGRRANVVALAAQKAALHKELDRGDGLAQAAGLDGGRRLHVYEEELEQAVGVLDVLGKHVVLVDEVLHHGVALFLAQPVVDRPQRRRPRAAPALGLCRQPDRRRDAVVLEELLLKWGLLRLRPVAAVAVTAVSAAAGLDHLPVNGPGPAEERGDVDVGLFRVLEHLAHLDQVSLRQKDPRVLVEELGLVEHLLDAGGVPPGRASLGARERRAVALSLLLLGSRRLGRGLAPVEQVAQRHGRRLRQAAPELDEAADALQVARPERVKVELGKRLAVSVDVLDVFGVEAEALGHDAGARELVKERAEVVALHVGQDGAVRDGLPHRTRDLPLHLVERAAVHHDLVQLVRVEPDGLGRVRMKRARGDVLAFVELPCHDLDFLPPPTWLPTRISLASAVSGFPPASPGAVSMTPSRFDTRLRSGVSDTAAAIEATTAACDSRETSGGRLVSIKYVYFSSSLGAVEDGGLVGQRVDGVGPRLELLRCGSGLQQTLDALDLVGGEGTERLHLALVRRAAVLGRGEISKLGPQGVVRRLESEIPRRLDRVRGRAVQERHDTVGLVLAKDLAGLGPHHVRRHLLSRDERLVGLVDGRDLVAEVLAGDGNLDVVDGQAVARRRRVAHLVFVDTPGHNVEQLRDADAQPGGENLAAVDHGHVVDAEHVRDEAARQQRAEAFELNIEDRLDV
ncbi:hypothetical protein ColTof3_14887 [Colletotrichum tofieldiae]|nr:hypothetical protein ColTof3_14887 [Colletotrichum tofieldiae]